MPFLLASSGWVAAGRCAYLRSAVVAAMSSETLSRLTVGDRGHVASGWPTAVSQRISRLALRVLVNAEGFTLSCHVVRISWNSFRASYIEITARKDEKHRWLQHSAKGKANSPCTVFEVRRPLAALEDQPSYDRSIHLGNAVKHTANVGLIRNSKTFGFGLKNR
jgi:hypothetical protein